MIRLIGWLIGLTVIAVPVALVVAIMMALENQPLVKRGTDLTPAHVERAKGILKQNDPRRMAPGTERTVTLTQEEADLVLNYLATRYGKGGARVVLRPGMVLSTISIELPSNPVGRYLNVDAQLRETGGLPVFEGLRIGSLPVPSWLGNWLLAQAAKRAAEQDQLHAITESVRAASVTEGKVSLTYLWRPEVLESIRSLVLPKEEQERLKAYHEQLVSSVGASSSAGVSLTELMTPLFKLADRRTTGSDAAAENRAAILALTFYVNGRGLVAILPAAKTWPQPAKRKVLLDRRDDFPKHFMISAAIAVTAGGPLSDAVGLYKEVEDSRGGSGFSFNDIAADRAGTRFGEMAARAASAVRLQKKIAAGASESEIMPPTRDLPEFMPEAEFKRRFGGIGAPAYQRMMDDIEKRIAALPIYR